MRTPEPVTCGHPERRHRSLGMCSPCYYAHWRRVTRERQVRIERRLGEYVGEANRVINDGEVKRNACA